MMGDDIYWENHWNSILNGDEKIEHCDLGCNWGNPDSVAALDFEGNLLGNYKKIKNEFLLPYLTKDSIILDIGSGGGKWLHFIKSVKKIISVDISDSALALIKLQFGNNVECYKTTGNELSQIASQSIDFIFSIDSLVRLPFEYLLDYFDEFKRVSKNEANVCIHLPYINSSLTKKFNFAPLTMEQLILLRNTISKHFIIDSDTLKHGILIRSRSKI